MPGKASNCHNKGDTVDNAPQISKFIQFVYQFQNYIILLLWFTFFKNPQFDYACCFKKDKLRNIQRLIKFKKSSLLLISLFFQRSSAYMYLDLKLQQPQPLENKIILFALIIDLRTLHVHCIWFKDTHSGKYINYALKQSTHNRLIGHQVFFPLHTQVMSLLVKARMIALYQL